MLPNTTGIVIVKGRPHIPKSNPKGAPRNRESDRLKIQRHTEAFLMSGGKVEKVGTPTNAEIIQSVKGGIIEYKDRPL
ncbi:MAG: hypothetical protein JKY67_08445 [Pseudomonadales bacterium]|nr:hypothetical protein [Pseudomonadales bacterium]